MLPTIHAILRDLGSIRLESNENRDKIFKGFDDIGADVKEVYSQLDAAFNKNTRERADMNVEVKKLTDKMEEVTAKNNNLFDRTMRFDDFIEDVITQQEMQLALDAQDESDKRSVALFGLMDD